jgi:phage gpG-like protein
MWKIDIVSDTISPRIRQLRNALGDDLPTVVGTEAVEMFKENFQSEAWGCEPWQEVERRKATWTRGGKEVPNPIKGAKRSRKILTGDTGDLARSIEYTVDGDKVEVGSELVYARVHNEGLRAGRGAGFIMPKRQFIGESPAYHRKLIQRIKDYINNILR